MLKQGQVQKQTVRLSMKLWLPILESSLTELAKSVDEMSASNPYVEVKKGLENEFKLRNKDVKKFQGAKSTSLDESSGALTSEESLYDKLLSQIEAPLFPTESSKKVAELIVQNLNEDGFFDGDIATPQGSKEANLSLIFSTYPSSTPHSAAMALASPSKKPSSFRF